MIAMGIVTHLIGGLVRMVAWLVRSRVSSGRILSSLLRLKSEQVYRVESA